MLLLLVPWVCALQEGKLDQAGFYLRKRVTPMMRQLPPNDAHDPAGTFTKLMPSKKLYLVRLLPARHRAKISCICVCVCVRKCVCVCVRKCVCVCLRKCACVSVCAWPTPHHCVTRMANTAPLMCMCVCVCVAAVLSRHGV